MRNGQVIACVCQLERLITRELPPHYRSAQVADFSPIHQCAVRQWASAPRGGLLITGPVGAGKTHLAAAIVRMLIRQGKRAVFRRSAEFYGVLREAYNSNIAERVVMEPLLAAPFLVLDDLGAGSLRDHERRSTLELIDRRLNALLPSIVTTNLLPQEIAEALFRQLDVFAADKGLRYVQQLDLDRLSEFRATWKDGPRAGGKKLERLRAWLGFCERRKWIPDNPARHLQAPKVADRPTLPFTTAEMVKIFATLDTRYAKRAGLRNAQRLKAFVLLLRYSGLRIGDAVSTDEKRITGGKIFLYTAKTGTPVYCPLPPVVIEALEAAPHSGANYFFWSGRSTLKSAVGKW